MRGRELCPGFCDWAANDISDRECVSDAQVIGSGCSNLVAQPMTSGQPLIAEWPVTQRSPSNSQDGRDIHGPRLAVVEPVESIECFAEKQKVIGCLSLGHISTVGRLPSIPYRTSPIADRHRPPSPALPGDVRAAGWHHGAMLPAFSLTAHPLTSEAAALPGFRSAGPEVGTRHRLGGEASFLDPEDYPSCDCGQPMTFYGQLDSINDDHCLADVGVVAVFVCFDCFAAQALVCSS